MKRTTKLLAIALTAEAAIIYFPWANNSSSAPFQLTMSESSRASQMVVTQTVQYSTTVVQTYTTTLSQSHVSPSSTTSTPTPPPTSSSSISDTSTSTVPVPTSTPNEDPNTSSWAQPNNMTDLHSFNVTYFPAGAQNLALVTGIPASASATGAAFAAMETGGAPSWDNSTSVLQLFYPANSKNPANQPQGGAEFYAAPIDIAQAQNASLEYSVFFPVDFAWVLGGKLPGIYGGHTTCSGGNSADDCFSTRLMWRKDGVGELYLYAPKDKQTDDLCSDPQSVCDTSYGFSIGRGSFRWGSGVWTHIRQVISLNTPGETDGVFTLDVNGRRVIDRADIFYRDDPSNKESQPEAPPQPSNGGGLLGPILGGLFGGSKPLSVASSDTQPRLALGPQQVIELQQATDLGPEENDDQVVAEDDEDDPPEDQPENDNPVGFTGLFFSTFFGGHDSRYATPRDQYVWFKDFSMSSA